MPSWQPSPTLWRDRLTFEVLLGTGIRLGSVVSLNIADVDLAQATLHIHAKGGHRHRKLGPQS